MVLVTVRDRALKETAAVPLNHHVVHASLVRGDEGVGLSLIGVPLLELIETLVLNHLLGLRIPTQNVMIAYASINVACKTHQLCWNEAIWYHLSG